MGTTIVVPGATSHGSRDRATSASNTLPDRSHQRAPTITPRPSSRARQGSVPRFVILTVIIRGRSTANTARLAQNSILAR